MALSALAKRNLAKILPFGVIWLIFGALFLWVEAAVLGGQENAAATAVKLDAQIVTFALSVIFLIGCIVGFIEVKYLSRWFEKNSFLVKIGSKFFIYLLFFLLIIVINFPIAASLELDTTIVDQRVWDKFYNFFFSITHLSAIIQLSFSLMISLLYAEVSDHLGQQVMLNFFTGKYHNPIEEERIFMFVDMKDSTTIAEKIGNQHYFELLRSYYFTFSNAIIKNQGEVYQYVGDEIVITWKLKRGITNNQCIQCFFDMKKDLQKKQKLYHKKYGVELDFKAALHYGHVITGEIGALKKDIFFTGDVLNTTARILGLASVYREDLLLSEPLSRKLNLPETYTVKKLGAPSLKGKADSVEIVAVYKN
ncbi:adenylate/guanylate cyclase domain-containing protein [Dokdonia ponticola]|uniref:Adenylate/guanylate cyclase domain-containing protein n=1 Tax=Dokdonia ponticola TaxID=2041041 RepID=A0ABV9I4E8_9FLAO